MMKFSNCNIPKKTSFRASKRLRKFRTRKNAKNSKFQKLPESCFEPVGKGGWPPISTWISPPSFISFTDFEVVTNFCTRWRKMIRVDEMKVML
jgi:hypothetical protein